MCPLTNISFSIFKLDDGLPKSFPLAMCHVTSVLLNHLPGVSVCSLNPGQVVLHRLKDLCEWVPRETLKFSSIGFSGRDESEQCVQASRGTLRSRGQQCNRHPTRRWFLRSPDVARSIDCLSKSAKTHAWRSWSDERPIGEVVSLTLPESCESVAEFEKVPSVEVSLAKVGVLEINPT